MFLAMNVYNLNTVNSANYSNATSGFVHYFHGVNPNYKTYLSNMNPYGAENSVTSFYHGWFEDGSALWDEVGVSTYGPAPGFIPGGPNPGYDWDACCPTNCGSPQNNALCTSMSISPPKNQPIQKSYLDFNNGWPLNSWTVTEAGIYTNAAYVRMLSKFCGTGCVLTSDENPVKDENKIIVYPSPAKDDVNISFVGMNGNSFKVEVYDISGKLLKTEKISLFNNTRIFAMSINELSAGIYFLKISNATEVISKKFVKS